MRKISIGLMMVCLLGAPVDRLLAASQEENDAWRIIAQLKRTERNVLAVAGKSVGYVVFPSITKGALIIGGARGSGLVFEHDRLIGRVTMTQGTFGLQFGGESFSEVIFFKSEAALKAFKNNQFTFSGQAGANAGSTGSSESANYQADVDVFTIAKGGLLVDVSVGGQKFKFTPGR